jgi:DNA-binding LacI/PurR family transcriptional regulator
MTDPDASAPPASPSLASRPAPSAPAGRGRRPRLSDVAARAGVSAGLVSLVLRHQPGPSEQTRTRVFAAARDLGYRADRTASLLARRRSQHLGVVMDVRNTFHAELVAEMDAAATQRGYDLVLSALTPTRDQRAATEILLDFRCEGLILIGSEDRAGWLSALGQELPVVSVGRRLKPDSLDVVRAADDLGVAQAVAHLASLGHRDIAFVDGGRGPIAADRRRGYRQAMRGLGLAGRIRVIAGDHTEEAGLRAAPELLQSPATAVVASNDRCAVGLLDRLARLGTGVPASMSVVGYDDSMLARLGHVDLTSVSQDAPRQAEEAVSLLAERLDQGRIEPREVILPPRLIVRGTTAPPSG